jgi:hypothetical protein
MEYLHKIKYLQLPRNDLICKIYYPTRFLYPSGNSLRIPYTRQGTSGNLIKAFAGKVNILLDKVLVLLICLGTCCTGSTSQDKILPPNNLTCKVLILLVKVLVLLWVLVSALVAPTTYIKR